MNANYVDNPLVILGVFIFLIGVFLFVFGRKWFLFRLLLGDISMISQMFYGTILSIIGLILLYMSGRFN
ncbi:hypothetical protein DXC12_08260 [Melissococcus sp. OM08-11BH]|nr:hypothetical protein DXC12_08260 [Melissococcus sp. OM08-11BH]RHH67793.1 hypothetical protein DW196_08850 [Vagococcus sp. AM17-17]